MEINLNGGTKVCVDGKKRSTQMGEGRKDEYKDQINKRDRFGARLKPDAELGRAVFFEIEISPSTSKIPIRFCNDCIA